MPLTLNVGLSRKVGEPNYGSRGADVHLELELDGTLIDDPERLRDRIRYLFGLARLSVEEELDRERQQPVNGEATRSGAGAASPNRPAGSSRGATQSQVRAIQTIADRRRLNLPQMLQQRFGVVLPQQLTLKEASRLLDDLNTAPERSTVA